ncbi:DNA repair endonuclease xp-f / mei-9 / rad1, putative [Ixodes scapularis]|uniref:DNA repair endonuclease xp-f / mei-9 / rad1, putative n=1 Tax=Ixodes scapularis TaxID=6945 RepID=B7P865_IXOSC|nr:DNA repair endonuclease xp-f / mei-9 / rad1, putative [Ixodes scapularis]|eukprot:XP_002401556.1 DNA repair endonuclease xp-f / mei-9 / rad1, putative [Ixodes scapularis]
MSMLEFETQLFLDLHNEDGLVILAKGLGIERLLLSLIKVHNDPGNLVLVLGTTSQEEEFFISRLEADNVNPLPKSITADCSTKDRNDVYLAGGVLFVTSRILVVDMLTERIPINLITGIIVYHAHKTLESCQEAFILRLYRQKNKTGFIKGLSDNAVAFTYGFCQVQRMMRNLFVKKLFLWPRFQADVIASLNKRKPDVVELRVGMTPAMQAIQLAILDIVASCVREIKRVNPSMEMDDLTVENLIARSFEKIIKFQLDPIWHQLGAKTRHLVSDIKTLRTILQYLTQYDCVTFYSLVKSVRDAGTMTSQISDWFFLDAAETLFLQAKARVYGSEQKLHKEEAKGKEATTKGELSPSEATLRMEESPKWAALSEILVEIGRENKDCGDLNSVLVIAEDDRVCGQLTEYLCCGGQAVLRKIYRKSVADKDGLLLPRLPSTSEDVQKSPQKTKKKQSKPKVGDTDSDDVEESDATEAATAVFPPNLPNTVFHPLRSSAFALQQLLLTVEPKYIVLYDVNIATVREIEMYQATRAKEVLRVYFLMYEDSVDEQRYLTALRREKDAFEFLIREKNVMVVPEEQDGKGDYHPDLVDELSLSNETVSSRKAGGAPVKPSGSRKVIVDLREFRSDLPSLIHRRGISVQPVTIEVGDYILTPDICVERKSLNDLIGSLNSGRLYNQAQSMCRYYKRPVLLIEFSQNQPFCLQDFLLHLPGVNLKNQALLTRKFTNLVEMFAASEEELASAMGNAAQAKLLWESIHRPTEPKPQKPPPRKFRKK